VQNTVENMARRAEQEKLLVSDLKAMAKSTSNLITVEEKVAEHLWAYRLTFTVTSKGKEMPDYHGRSDGYKAGFDRIKTKAGLVILEATTPFEAEAIRLANDRIDNAVRKQVRRIADKELSLSELLAAGFKRSKALPADQKIPASQDTGARTTKRMPIDTVLEAAINGLKEAATRPSDIRDLSIEQRQDLLDALVNAAGIVARVLKPTRAEVAAAVPSPEKAELVSA